MVRILFIDDNIERIQQISSWLTENNIECETEYSMTKDDALRKLTKTQYDLVLVDIVLPNNMSTIGLSNFAGMEIINEIVYSNSIIRPLCLLGITSNEESYDNAKTTFDKNFLSLTIWDESNEEWKIKFISKVKYISKLSLNYRSLNSNKVHSVIIATVDDEYEALEKLPVKWESCSLKNDPLLFSCTNYEDINGISKKLLRVKLPEMGMSAASHVTTKIISVFDPETIVMVGICGGKKDEVNLGDIIVAEKSWDYGSGKVKCDKKNNIVFSALPNQINIDTNLKSNIIRNADLVKDIYIKWNESNNDDKKSEFKIGAIATGSAVISNEDFIEKIIEPQYRKVMGIDMETYGVYFACQNSGQDIKFVSIKSVSDLADVDKDDSYHSYGSYASALFAYKLLEKSIL